VRRQNYRVNIPRQNRGALSCWPLKRTGQARDPSPPRPAERGAPSALRSPLSPGERETMELRGGAPRRPEPSPRGEGDRKAVGEGVLVPARAMCFSRSETGPHAHRNKKMKIEPVMCMKIQVALTKRPVNYQFLTRKCTHCATIDNNRLELLAELHGSSDKSHAFAVGCVLGELSNQVGGGACMSALPRGVARASEGLKK